MKETNPWIQIARCSDTPLREGRAVKLGDCEIAVFNLDDRFLAINNRCPHRAGPLADGIVCGAAVICPLHAWKFSLETGEGVNGASSSSCVQTYRTRVKDGIVLLQVRDPRNQSEESQGLSGLCTPPRGIPTMTDCSSAAEA
jgi:nitrite reductase (NADH) small subunit